MLTKKDLGAIKWKQDTLSKGKSLFNARENDLIETIGQLLKHIEELENDRDRNNRGSSN